MEENLLEYDPGDELLLENVNDNDPGDELLIKDCSNTRPIVVELFGLLDPGDDCVVCIGADCVNLCGGVDSSQLQAMTNNILTSVES